MKSEKLDLLATALAEAQAEMPAVPMNAVNPFLKNRYADLAEMIRVASPILSKHGLSISQQPATLLGTPQNGLPAGLVGVVTTLLHKSGQFIQSEIYLPVGDQKGLTLAQVTGSIITYLRRYSFGAICGLATDEDTDGNAPVKNHEQPKVAYQAKPEGKMTLEFANGETNRDGVKYGDIDTETLSNMANALTKMKTRTDEQERKLTAAQTILSARNGG